ncbi:MAG: hypothetical protein J0M15_08150 [Deltaproteobacteria bacterium]|nr:hypothetical protein [Deltaproteobacteria bacterium]
MKKLGCYSDGYNLFPGLHIIERYFLEKESPLAVSHLTLQELTQMLTHPSPDCHYVRCSANYSRQLLNTLSIQPENVSFLGIFDCLIYEGNQWLPRLNYFSYLRALFVKKFKYHKINNAVALICKANELPALISFVVGLGHQQILIFNESGTLDDFSHVLKHSIGTDLKIYKYSDLTQVNINTNLMINTIDLESHTNLLGDLAYFNFMVQGGVVMDLYSSTPVNPFLFEAEKADLSTMNRREVVSYYDYGTLLKLGLISSFEREKYFQLYSEIATID